jgi:hypothetical protein
MPVWFKTKLPYSRRWAAVGTAKVKILARRVRI